MTDVTDLVNARDHLRKAESMFRNTFDQAPIGVGHADRAADLPALQTTRSPRLLGFDSGDRGHDHRRPHAPRDIARVSAELERRWSGEVRIRRSEKRHVRKDGSFHWFG